MSKQKTNLTINYSLPIGHALKRNQGLYIKIENISY
jgi:hypothetical protein